MCGLMARFPTLLIPIVYPSGVARAKADKPTPPPAPARFEIITGTPRYSPSFLATGREKVSMDPPAGKATMNVTGLSDHFFAWAAAGNPKEKTIANTRKYL